jgi:hypothetical protein
MSGRMIERKEQMNNTIGGGSKSALDWMMKRT